jgi:hypothetical protein
MAVYCILCPRLAHVCTEYQFKSTEGFTGHHRRDLERDGLESSRASLNKLSQHLLQKASIRCCARVLGRHAPGPSLLCLGNPLGYFDWWVWWILQQSLPCPCLRSRPHSRSKNHRRIVDEQRTRSQQRLIRLTTKHQAHAQDRPCCVRTPTSHTQPIYLQINATLSDA